MADIVYGGAADGAMTPTNTTGYATGVTSVCDSWQAMRIKFDGVLTQIKIRSVLTDLTAGQTLPGVTVQVWRDASETGLGAATLVGSSAVPSNQLVDNTWTTLTTPIAVRAGDAVGINYDGTTTSKLGLYGTGVADQSFLYENTDKTASGAWPPASATRQMCVQYKGTPADLLTYGDSIMCGHRAVADGTSWAGFAEDAVDGKVFYSAGYRNYTFNVASLLKSLYGATVAGAAGSGKKGAQWGVATWAANVTPYIAAGAQVFTNFGINDLVLGLRTLAQHQTDWGGLLSAAAGCGATLRRIAIMHVATGYTYDGHDAAYWNALVDTWNATMGIWCVSNGVANIAPTTLIQMAAISDYLSSDYIHPTQRGYERMAALAATIDPGVANVLAPAAGGPANYKINGSTLIGTMRPRALARVGD